MSHVVTFEEYLNIMQLKAMAKATINDIRKCKWKEKEEKKSRKAIETFTLIEWTIRRSIEKQTRGIFVQVWWLVFDYN